MVSETTVCEFPANWTVRIIEALDLNEYGEEVTVYRRALALNGQLVKEWPVSGHLRRHFDYETVSMLVAHALWEDLRAAD